MRFHLGGNPSILRYFTRRKQRVEMFRVKIMEYDVMSNLLQGITHRVRYGMVQAERIRMTEYDKYLQVYSPPCTGVFRRRKDDTAAATSAGARLDVSTLFGMAS